MILNPPRTAFITGITGQDGSYLAELLLSKGYLVHGMIRRSSGLNTRRIDHLRGISGDDNPKLFLHYGDLADGRLITDLLMQIEPDEVYNLGAQTHVRVSFEAPVYTHDITGAGALRVFEAARRLNERKPVRLYQASSSEMFGDVNESPQTEMTPFQPCNPYACAKVFAHNQMVKYRESCGLFACSGILFNHESPRRGEAFVSRKITRAVGRIREGLQDKLLLGSLDAKRDWGYAKEYVEAMWQMLQHDVPGDYVIATNETHSVREFVEEAFRHAGLDWQKYVEFDQRYARPSEGWLLQGDYSKARKILGWKPRTTFRELVHLMVDADRQIAAQEKEDRKNSGSHLIN